MLVWLNNSQYLKPAGYQTSPRINPSPVIKSPRDAGRIRQCGYCGQELRPDAKPSRTLMAFVWC